MSMKKYATRDRANVPTKVQLRDPGTGEETEDSLDILSSLSDKFIEARNAGMQEASSFRSEHNPKKRKELLETSRLKLTASLVAGWSFPEPCTEENVVEFLRSAPQVENMVIAVADDNSSFFAKPSEDSTDGRKKK